MLNTLTQTDTQLITQAALDYAESAYLGESDRMARALHPELAKRIVQPDKAGKSQLKNMTAPQLIELVGSGVLKQPEDRRQADVTILDQFRNMATVRVTMNDWVDYMHLAKYDDQWVIINVLWQVKG